MSTNRKIDLALQDFTESDFELFFELRMICPFSRYTQNLSRSWWGNVAYNRNQIHTTINFYFYYGVITSR